jgi:hypothetical protein
MFAAALGACLFTSGCDRGHSWGSAGGGGGHGLKEGVRYDYDIMPLTRDGRVVLVLASNGFSSSGGGTNDHGYVGYLKTADGERIEWSCTSKDGKSGAVVIAGQQFELSKGAVFLLTAKQNPLKVEQLSPDLSKLPNAESKELPDAIRNVDPRVVEFLKAAQGEK